MSTTASTAFKNESRQPDSTKGHSYQDIVVLLTATVEARGIAFLERRDPKIRFADYKNAFQRWINNPQAPALVLCENSGYDLAEIGEVLETTVAATKANLHRGRTALKAMVAERDVPRRISLDEGRMRLTRSGQETRLDKPSRTVRVGDQLVFALGGRLIAVTVEAMGVRRGPAAEAHTLYSALKDASSGEV